MANVKTQQDVLSDIAEKLDTVLGFLAVRGMESDPAKMVVRLKDMGMSAKSIARVSGLTENAVAIRLSRMKSAGAKKSTKKKAKASSKAAGPVVADAAPASPAADAAAE